MTRNCIARRSSKPAVSKISSNVLKFAVESQQIRFHAFSFSIRTQNAINPFATAVRSAVAPPLNASPRQKYIHCAWTIFGVLWGLRLTPEQRRLDMLLEEKGLFFKTRY